MLAYKLFKVNKDGSISSLFINKKQRYPKGEWVEATEHKTNGYKFRPFFHCTEKPIAPHLSLKNRKWFVVEVKDFEIMLRPEKQGGKWILAKQIKIVKEYV